MTPPVRSRTAGSAPSSTGRAAGIDAGAARTARRGAARHRFQYGVNTRYGPPEPAGRDVARGNDRDARERLDRDAPLPRRAAQPSLPRLREARSRPRSGGSLRAPVSTATRSASATVSPRRTTRPLPRDASEPRRSASASRRKATRFGAPKPASSSSSRTKTGTTSRRALHGGVKGGVVVHAEVPGEEDDGRAHRRLPRSPREVTRPVRRATPC